MKVLSNWRSVRLWESVYERDLRRRHSLSAHGILIGIVTLLLMWGAAALVRQLGGHSLALRYVITLGVGYVAYLLILRWWAQRLVEGRTDMNFDLPEGGSGLDTETGYAALARADGTGLGDLPGGSLDLASAADGELIVVPVVAIFLLGIAVALGAGWLVMLFFGTDVLLAVTLELAFSYVAARATVRLARAGWLSAAVKLTWKPLLGALICAVVLGAAIDVLLPDAKTLPQAVGMVIRK
ncbi:hypothetical protein WKW79_30215 [Variovorax robiniae]|uniref:Uncharacterized protein n=1 Tax=Variovorax robiniae TaxID=1836199 RepID=A0ABU8XG80_9BURK